MSEAISDASFPWFKEPLGHDETYARRGESTYDWLARSTIPRAVACRRFLNEHISKLPLKNPEMFVHDLRNKWDSTFFELIVGRYLQELGATVSIEDAISNGKRPDFRAEFVDAAVTIEAVAPLFDGDSVQRSKANVPLLNFIESKIPKGWQVGVWQLPKIGHNDSKRDFKRAVEYLLDLAPSQPGESDRELFAYLPSGTIHLWLFPSEKDNSRLFLEGAQSMVDNSKERVHYAFHRKRVQVKESPDPVLLAIHASGICSDSEAFETALFGPTFNRLDGIFTKKTDGVPTYAGILAFIKVGFNRCDEPVLYMHPRFSGVLPKELTDLEQRSFNTESKQTCIKPASLTKVAERLNLVTI